MKTPLDAPFLAALTEIDGQEAQVFFFRPANFSYAPGTETVEVYEDRNGEMIPHDVQIDDLSNVKKYA